MDSGHQPDDLAALGRRADNTLGDLHCFIQIAFAWTDYHLHRFRIHGKEFGIPRLGGPWYSQDARAVRLVADGWEP